MSETSVSHPSTKGETLFDKVWKRHVVYQRDDGYTLLYIDRHYLGDDLPRETFDTLARRGLAVRRPEATYAMADHYAATRGHGIDDIVDDERRSLVKHLVRFTHTQGIPMFALDDARHGIVHVVGPEQGLTLPGMTVVCGDSHTSTHGAFGAFGFGIGSSEVSHVLATQTLWQKRPRTLLARIDGALAPAVTAKDAVLALIGRIGAAGATGHVIEYQGSVVRELSMEGRMTLCNMSIEAGARAGMIAPDERTFAYLQGRAHAPESHAWTRALADWKTLRSDEDAEFDRYVRFDASGVAPMVTWGTSPADAVAIDGISADPSQETDPLRRARLEHALAYMGIDAAQKVAGLPIDRVFIGSCTNGRIEDLRLAASVLAGHHVRVPTMVVPGSRAVRLAAQREGLDRVFMAAGADWREPGCSMCLAINGDEGRPGERVASTSNRNFVGRQGRGVRTHLMNPGMAAAAAVTGCLVDYREMLRDARIDRH